MVIVGESNVEWFRRQVFQNRDGSWPVRPDVGVAVWHERVPGAGLPPIGGPYAALGDVFERV